MNNRNHPGGFARLAAACILLVAGALTSWSQPSFGTFSNGGDIAIFDESVATPYPSTIDVTGMTGTVTRVTVTLWNITHDFPDDIDILLVAPDGRKSILMSDAGGPFPISENTIVFDQTAPPIPNSMELTNHLYSPGNYGFSNETFSAPAPVGPYPATLESFNGGNPNGAWSLYVMDDISENFGAIADGWTLTISTAQQLPSLAIKQVNTTAEISWPTTSPGYTLESRASVQSSVVWIPVTNSVTITNGLYRVGVPISGARLFFRLRK